MSKPISKKEFDRRRKRLLEQMTPGSVAIIPGATEQRRNKDIDFPFRQDSDFLYLTGFHEPESLLVLLPGRAQGESVLFCRERDETAEQWHGERLGPERASQMLGVDDAFPINDIEDILPNMLEGRARIYITLGEYPSFDAKLIEWVKTIQQRELHGAKPPGEFVALKHLLHEMRLVKSAAELRVMRKAAAITVQAHERAMRECHPGMMESQLEAELVHEFMRSGARSPAYPSIVGGGNNACVLHYTDNAASLKDGDLVLIDAGCEYQYYAADVTRTFPVGGKFSKEQAAIYALVLAAQEAAIDVCRPGTGFDKPDRVAMRVMVQGLIDLKLLKGSLDKTLTSKAAKAICPHKTSHWLGIDVHDVGDYRIEETWRTLEPGMVLTIEPGIYLSELNKNIPAKWRGIGVRIEDDIVITKSAPEVLTAGAAKSIADIEQLVGCSG